MLLIAPVAIILVAENLGHIKAVAAMTGRDLDRYMGRAFAGDGIATIVAGYAGGTGVTTYAENIGVMAVTKIYSTLVFVVAALDRDPAGLLAEVRRADPDDPRLRCWAACRSSCSDSSRSPGAKIWVDNRVDFSRNRNLVIAAVTLVLGAGDFALSIGGFTLGGIGTATFGAILLNLLLRGDTRPRSARIRSDSSDSPTPRRRCAAAAPDRSRAMSRRAIRLRPSRSASPRVAQRGNHVVAGRVVDVDRDHHAAGPRGDRRCGRACIPHRIRGAGQRTDERAGADARGDARQDPPAARQPNRQRRRRRRRSPRPAPRPRRRYAPAGRPARRRRAEARRAFRAD